ncbi:MAG: DNA polymerase III subunit gamma/tau [Ilumatobacteraceae bacterium]
MATQSLYRRYRPRRFSELKGQDHVVRALRNAVINHREGQAYLFSGPRGTGKTTSARILAKVLNCERPVDGEPCCECESCVSVERGTSYDVHELDAASNNGVEAMRDLIEKTMLGTPGRHKVYILDEVHMLSKGAEAALLKTLEEPPPHVVFVLATTDPQKVSDTIRSRTQHLQFHLLPMDVMEEHIRWLAADAGIDLGDDLLQAVLRKGGGSARDTVSALELVASAGGEALEITPLDEFIEAFIEHDPGRALAVVAHAVQQGRDPRTLTDDLIRHLRDCFLSIMAPELVQLPAARAAEVSELARRLGAAATVRAMERLGVMLLEMRHAPDQRLLLEVALVQLTHEASSVDVAVLLDRVERLEQQVASGVAAQPASRPDPVDPVTGRTVLGGRARRDPAPSRPSSAPTGGAEPSSARPAASTAAPPSAPSPRPPAEATDGASSPVSAPPTAPPTVPAISSTVDDGSAVDRVAAAWTATVVPSLKGMARALFAATKVLGERDGALAVGVGTATTRDKCQRYLSEVERAIDEAFGVRLKVVVVVSVDGDDDHSASVPPAGVPVAAAGDEGSVDEVVDIAALEDVPPDQVVTPEKMLKDAFPSARMVDEP